MIKLKISAVQVVSGCGRGEVHVNHGGELIGYEAELNALAVQMGGSSLNLSEEFWVYHDPNINENSSSKLCKKIDALLRKR